MENASSTFQLTNDRAVRPAPRSAAGTTVLFDLSIRGHHPSYLRHLIRYALRDGWDRSISIVVSPAFVREHADVVALTEACDSIEFVPISEAEFAALPSRHSKWGRIRRYFDEWNLLRRYAEKLNAAYCVVMYLDTYLFPLALGASLPCPFSGIYFRPTFHYGEFVGDRPSRKDRLQRWREKLVLGQVLQQQNCHRLLCLDRLSVDAVDRLSPMAKAVPIPDPLDFQPASPERIAEIRAELGIEDRRRVALLFGALNERKGVVPLIDSLRQLSPESCSQLCLLLMGESSIVDRLEAQIAEVCRERPVQILRKYEFLPEADIPAYFQLCDLVLAPYQRHVGMSGILIWAAAAGKPVLSSDYGLMGELVRRYDLGIAVDSTKSEEIARGLTQWLLDNNHILCNKPQLEAFARENAAEEFSRVIFEAVEEKLNPVA
ncbi:MAG: glycosyltransferase [Cyanobacteria bacterium SID2]|nr:glycosyltransferase [Cyanobacteria bacterium SID2]MBP0002621.1 glycosyltransferase [Cyanobacteria bacterium SBC]